MGEEKKTIGIWDKGNGTQVIDSLSEGFDVGLKSEGKNLMVKNFKAINGEKSSVWYEKWWMKYFVFPFIVALVVAIIIFLFRLSK